MLGRRLETVVFKASSFLYQATSTPDFASAALTTWKDTRLLDSSLSGT